MAYDSVSDPGSPGELGKINVVHFFWRRVFTTFQAIFLFYSREQRASTKWCLVFTSALCFFPDTLCSCVLNQTANSAIFTYSLLSGTQRVRVQVFFRHLTGLSISCARCPGLLILDARYWTITRQFNTNFEMYKWLQFRGTSIRKNCIPYYSPKSMKKWCYSWLQPIKTIYEVEAYDVFQVISWLITISRHPSDCNSLREEQLQNLDMVCAGQGLYP